MTWITDNNGTRWVDPIPRKTRKPGRALRFADLKTGDLMIHRQKYRHEITRARTDQRGANDNPEIKQGVIIGFAICEHRWFDPVRGQKDPVAGELAGVRLISGHGAYQSLRTHTLRGLAQNGYWPADDHQSAAVRDWLNERERLTEQVRSRETTLKKARAQYKTFALLLRELGLATD